MKLSRDLSPYSQKLIASKLILSSRAHFTCRDRIAFVTRSAHAFVKQYY